MKFRKKPVVIDAIQWTGDNLREIKEFMGVDSVPYDAKKDSFLIKTLEGNHEASKGDWVIKGVKGEFYPCKPDIFEMTYEKVGEVTESQFHQFADMVLGKLKPNEPYAKLLYPVEYQEWNRDVMIVADILNDEMSQLKWYRENSDQIFKVIAYSCLASKYVNEMTKGKFRVSYGHTELPERGCPHCSCKVCHHCGKVKTP